MSTDARPGHRLALSARRSNQLRSATGAEPLVRYRRPQRAMLTRRFASVESIVHGKRGAEDVGETQ